jgi:DNA topoisomerase-2
LIEVLKDEYERLDNKAKFIDLVINKKLVYINRKEEDVLEDMKKYELKQIFPRKKKNVLIVDEDEPEEEGTGYEYLFSINVRGFTSQKVTELLKQKEEKYEALQDIQGTPPKTFWRRDLEALMAQWDAVLEEDELLAKEAKPLASANKKLLKRKRVVKPKAPKATAAKVDNA